MSMTHEQLIQVVIQNANETTRLARDHILMREETTANRQDIQSLQTRVYQGFEWLLAEQREDSKKICIISGFFRVGEEGYDISEEARDWHTNFWAESAGIRISIVQPSRVPSVSHTNGRGEMANSTVVRFHSNTDRNRMIQWWVRNTHDGQMHIKERNYTSQNFLRIRSGQPLADDMRALPYKAAIASFYVAGMLENDDKKDWYRHTLMKANGARMMQVEHAKNGNCYVRVDDDFYTSVKPHFDAEYTKTKQQWYSASEKGDGGKGRGKGSKGGKDKGKGKTTTKGKGKGGPPKNCYMVRFPVDFAGFVEME